MLLITKKHLLELKQECPDYFREVWKGKTGTDPFKSIVRAQQLLTGGFLTCLISAVLWLTFYAIRQSYDHSVAMFNISWSIFLAGMLCLIFGAFMGITTADFESSSKQVIGYLGRTPGHIADMDRELLSNIAVDNLRHFGNTILWLDEGSKITPDEAKEMMLNALRVRYKFYQFWELVPNGGDDGWKKYTTPRS